MELQNCFTTLAHKEIVSSKIEEGYAAAQRGELLDADEVRARMAERKRARR